MQILFETRDPRAASLKSVAEDRARFVTRRLNWLVPRARIQLSDINGRRGGVDKRCQVELLSDRTGTVVITALARDWRSAIDSALARAAHALMRLWQRARPHGRHRTLPHTTPR